MRQYMVDLFEQSHSVCVYELSVFQCTFCEILTQEHSACVHAQENAMRDTVYRTQSPRHVPLQSVIIQGANRQSDV